MCKIIEIQIINIFALPRESRPDEDVDVSLPAMLEEDRRFQRLIRFSLCWAVRSDCMAKTLDLLHDDETYLNRMPGMCQLNRR